MPTFRDTLKTLFTRNVVVKRLPGNRLKVFDVNKTQAQPETSSTYSNRIKWRNGRNFSSVSGYGSGFVNYEVEALRKLMYLEYELMDTDSIISSALDIISDEATSNSPTGELLVINSDDDKLKQILHNLFYDILNIEFNLWSWVRTTCKYGDNFLYLQIQENFGIVNVIPIHPSLMTREEGTNEDPNRILFRYEGDGQFYTAQTAFEQYEVAHFRLIGDSNLMPYGKSTIENARKEYKRLCIPWYGRVATPNGFKLMKDLVVGDVVLSHNTDTGKLFKTNVKHHIHTGDKEVFEVTTSNRKFYGTIEHPFLTSNGYKTIGELTKDDLIITSDGSPDKIIDKISVGIEPVYDIEVDNEYHNFIVNGVVAHNCLVEDSMVMHRVMRAPERRIYKIDVGNIPPNEIDAHMEQIMSEMKKTPFIDPNTGDYNLRYNLMNSQEDFFLPVRGGESGTTIETLPGLGNDGQLEDVEYLKSKMMAALKIPKAYLGYDDTESKSGLATMDIRFARMVERIQKIIVSELYKIAIIHLHTQGYESSELLNFELTLTSPSLIYERQKIDLLNEKFNLIANILETNLLSDVYIYENILGLSEQEWQQEKMRLPEFLKEKFRYQQITDEGNDPKSTGRSFGTPHDIASMQVASKMGGESESMKHLYSPDERENNEGQPFKYKKFETRKDTEYGRDPLGRREMSKTNESYLKMLKKTIPKKPTIIKENDGILDEDRLLKEDI